MILELHLSNEDFIQWINNSIFFVLIQHNIGGGI